MLKKFYAVTTTSLYEVYCDETNAPFMKKIALRKKSSVQVGGIAGGNGLLLSIGRQLIMFIPEGGGITSFQRRLEMVNTRYWVSNTSPIIALFCKKKDALVCHNSEKLKECDKRWIVLTKEVLALIGKDHPAFSICHFPGMSLLK